MGERREREPGSVAVRYTPIEQPAPISALRAGCGTSRWRSLPGARYRHALPFGERSLGRLTQNVGWNSDEGWGRQRTQQLAQGSLRHQEVHQQQPGVIEAVDQLRGTAAERRLMGRFPAGAQDGAGRGGGDGQYRRILDLPTAPGMAQADIDGRIPEQSAKSLLQPHRSLFLAVPPTVRCMRLSPRSP